MVALDARRNLFRKTLFKRFEVVGKQRVLKYDILKTYKKKLIIGSTAKIRVNSITCLKELVRLGNAGYAR